MLTVIDHEFRYEYNNGEHLGTYIDSRLYEDMLNIYKEE